MISKAEFEHLKRRIKKLEDKLWEYENKNPLYLKYEGSKQLPEQEKVTLQKEWNTYYQQVDTSPLGQALKEQWRALRQGNVALVKEYASKADTYPCDVRKPRLEDPEFLDYKMQGYHVTKSNLARMKDQYEEYLPIHGNKSDKEGSL